MFFNYFIIDFHWQLEITEFIPTLLYFGYTILIVFTFWILTGTIGFFAAYWFIRRIYGAIKIDWLGGLLNGQPPTFYFLELRGKNVSAWWLYWM